MKALVLAGGIPQIDLIQQLKGRGVETILVDGSSNPVALPYPDKFYQTDIFDVEAIKDIAMKENVDFLITVCADQVLLDIERRCQFHPAGPEADVIHQRMPDVADADQDRPKASVHTEDRSNLFPQRCDIVSVSLLAEFPEAAEILPDL